MSDAIKVAVRLRPLLPKENAERKVPLWEIEGRDKLVSLDAEKRGRAPQRFAFDRVFGLTDTNANVYYELVEPLVLSAVAGFNVTVFAYGQTASGKTHTMVGGPSEPGVIHRAIDSIFSAIENTPEREYLVRIAYMEIYNENVSDLLAHPKDRKNLKVSDVGGDVFIQNLREQPVINKEQILELMAQGHKQRHVGSTNMNEHSSRSHAIFRIVIESRVRDCEEYEEAADGAVQVSHLNLVDLAGSEKASQTGATGDRFKEGCAINASLLSLSLVIKKLSEGDKFISFRDSKLTHILRNSLGGNAKTAIICAVTPVVFDETLSTLNFASRAKTVTNDPHVNEVLTEQAQLKRYALIIRTLEKQLKQSGGATVDDMKRLLDEKESKIRELKEQLIVSSHVTTEPSKVELLRQARRMTWGGPALRAALSSRGSSKPTLFANPCSSMVRYNSEESIDSSFVDANVALSALREEDDEEGTDPEVFGCTCQRSNYPGQKVTTTESGVQTDLEAVVVCAPSTPVPVLRRRLTCLQETVKKQAVEYEELAEFTRLEKSLGAGDLSDSCRQLTKLTAELEQTRRTLSDTNGLLLETQKKLSLSEDSVQSLSQQVRELEDKQREAEITIERLEPLLSENQNLRKTMLDHQNRLKLLENEKQDWETVLQINAEAYKKKESELKQLLQEAWTAADIDPEFYSRALTMEKRISELTEELSRSQAESQSLRAAAEAANELAVGRFSDLEATLSAKQAQLDLKESEVRALRLQLDKAAVMATPASTQSCSLANELRLVSEGEHMSVVEESILEDFTVTVPSKPFLKRKTSSMSPQELLSQTLASLNASIFADSPLVKKYKPSDAEDDAVQEREEARAEIEGLKQQLLLLQEALIEVSNADQGNSLSRSEESGEGRSEEGNHSRLENIIVEKEALAEANEELEKRSKELEEQLEGLSKTAEELKVLKAELRSKDALILELDELTMNLREELESARSQVPMEATATDFKLEYEDASAKLKALLQEKDEYKQFISSKEEEWKRERVSLEEALESLKESCDKGGQENFDVSELLALRAQNADYQQEMAVMYQEKLRLKTEIDNLRSEIDTSRNSNQTYPQDSCAGCENLKERISELEAELQNIQASTAQSITELQNVVTEASDAREKLSGEIDEKRRLLDDLTLKRAELETTKNGQILALEQELTQARAKCADAMQERQHALDEAARYSQLFQSQLENKTQSDIKSDVLETELLEVKPIAPADHESSYVKSEDLEASGVSRRSSLYAVQSERDLVNQLDEKEEVPQEMLSNMNETELLKAEKINSLERELAEMRLAKSEALETCQRALEEAVKRVQQLEVDLVEKDKQLENAQSYMVEFESLKAQETGLLEELSHLKSANSQTNDQAHEACQRALDEAIERLQQLDATLVEKEKQLELVQLNMAEFRTSKAQEIGQLEEELSRLKSANAETNEQELEACKLALDEALERLRVSDAQLVEKKKQLEEFQLKMVEFQTSKAQEFGFLEEELSRLKSANSETKEQVLEACQQALDEASERVQQLNAQLTEKEDQLEKLQSNVAELEKSKVQEIGILEEELSRLKSASAESDNQSQQALEKARESVHSLRAQLEEREKSLQEMQLRMNELESVKMIQVESLQAELAQAKLDVARAREETGLALTRVQEEKEQLQSELQKLERELEERSAKIQNIETIAAEEVASLKEQLVQANLSQNQHNQELQKTIDEQINRHRELEAELQTKETLVKELAGKVTEMEALKDEIAARDSDLRELHLLRTEITSLKSTVLAKQDEWRQRMESMSQLTSDFERRLRDKENDICSLQVQCRNSTGLQNELSLKESLITQLETELKELRPLRQAKQELAEDLEDWQRKFNDLGDLFDMRNEKYEMACDDLAKADEEIKQLQQKLEAEIAASKELAVTKEKIRELLEQINALSTEKDTLSASLSTQGAELQRVTEAYRELEKTSKVKPVQPSEADSYEKLKREVSSLKMEICRLNGLIAVKELQVQNEDKPHQVRCSELQAETERYKKQIKELKEEVRLLSSRHVQEENTVALLATRKITKDAAVGTEEKAYGCGWCIRLPDIEKQLKKSTQEFESLQNDYDSVAKINEFYYKKMRKYRSLYYELRGEPEPPVPEISSQQMFDKELVVRKGSDPAAFQVLPQGSRILAENRCLTAGSTGAAQAKASIAGARASCTSGSSSSTMASSEEIKRTTNVRTSTEPELYQMKAFTASRSTHASLFDKHGLMKDSKEADWKTRFANFDFLDKDEKKSQQMERGSRTSGTQLFSLNDRATTKEQMENCPPTNKKLF